MENVKPAAGPMFLYVNGDASSSLIWKSVNPIIKPIDLTVLDLAVSVGVFCADITAHKTNRFRSKKCNLKQDNRYFLP